MPRFVFEASPFTVNVLSLVLSPHQHLATAGSIRRTKECPISRGPCHFSAETIGQECPISMSFEVF